MNGRMSFALLIIFGIIEYYFRSIFIWLLGWARLFSLFAGIDDAMSMPRFNARIFSLYRACLSSPRYIYFRGHFARRRSYWPPAYHFTYATLLYFSAISKYFVTLALYELIHILRFSFEYYFLAVDTVAPASPCRHAMMPLRYLYWFYYFLGAIIYLLIVNSLFTFLKCPYRCRRLTNTYNTKRGYRWRKSKHWRWHLLSPIRRRKDTLDIGCVISLSLQYEKASTTKMRQNANVSWKIK